MSFSASRNLLQQHPSYSAALTEPPATTSIIFFSSSRNLLQQHPSYSAPPHGTSCNNIHHILHRLTEPTTSIIFCTASRNLLQQHQSYSSEAHGTSCNNIHHILHRLTEPPATTSIIFLSSSRILPHQQKSCSSAAPGPYCNNIPCSSVAHGTYCNNINLSSRNLLQQYQSFFTEFTATTSIMFFNGSRNLIEHQNIDQRLYALTLHSEIRNRQLETFYWRHSIKTKCCLYVKNLLIFFEILFSIVNVTDYRTCSKADVDKANFCIDQ